MKKRETVKEGDGKSEDYDPNLLSLLYKDEI